MEIKLPSVQDIQTFLNFFLGNNIPHGIPPWVWILVKWGALILVTLIIISKFLSTFADIVDICKQRIRSAFYNEQERQSSKRRQLFAMYLEHEISRISIQEDWKDYRFAELEAEVEAEGRRKAFGVISFLSSPQSGTRHEKSLSKAIRASAEDIMLVEGEPGSGKSVALRHVALKMNEHAKKSRGTKSLLPIYVNLKTLERENGKEINRDLIEAFIFTTLRRSNDRDVELFLKDEFQIGMQEGSFFFLFDSFDELPEVLNSTEADDRVNEYGKAIDDFLHGMSRCRGVVASRFYKGPTRLEWKHFRILPLTESRQMELINKTNLEFTSQRELVGQLGNANSTIRSMASNPFFLTLLCRHIERGLSFPTNAHAVFETYINQRFVDDEKYLQGRFQIDVTRVRASAESIAFCMTASSSLGLSPSRSDLQNALSKLGLNANNPLEPYLDALEYMKLARSDTATNTNQSNSFTFSHRRFQEYFATCFLLKNPRRITAKELLTQGSWREAAVVLCQTQPSDKLAPLLKQVERLMSQFCSSVPNLINNPVEYIIAMLLLINNL